MQSATALPYRIVPYSANHKERVAALQRHLWHPDARLNAACLEWKYHRNPYIREPLIYLAFAGDTLVGMRGAVGSRWEVGETPACFTLPYADDLVIDPAHRGRGLHRMIMEFALADLARRGFRYAVNLSASPITAQGSLRMQWRNAGGVRPSHRRTLHKAVVDELARAARGTKFFWRWADALSSTAVPANEHMFDRLDARFASAQQRGRSPQLVLQRTPLVREMARLVARLPGNGRIRHVRDETYFAWRFANPLRNYRFLYAGGAQLEGYLVLQNPLGPGRDRVNIVDCEAATDRVGTELVAAAIDMQFPDLYAWTRESPFAGAQMLDRYGFTNARSDYELSILVRALSHGESAAPWMLGTHRMDDARDWDVRMLYSMQG